MSRSTDNKKVFDKADFLDRVEGDLELAAQLVELYFNDTAENMAKIRQAIADKDYEALICLAHSLKGASANLSGQRVRQTAYELENAAKKGELTGVAAVFARLEQELASFRKALQHQLLSTDGG